MKIEQFINFLWKKTTRHRGRALQVCRIRGREKKKKLKRFKNIFLIDSSYKILSTITVVASKG